VKVNPAKVNPARAFPGDPLPAGPDLENVRPRVEQAAYLPTSYGTHPWDFSVEKTGTSWAIMFERFDQYQVNANRGKGGNATTIATTSRSIPHNLLSVYDQKGPTSKARPAGQTSIPAAISQADSRSATSKRCGRC